MLYACVRTLDAAARVITESAGPALPSTLPPSVALTFDADNRVTTFNGQAVTYDPNGALGRALVRTRTVGEVATRTYHVYGLGLIGQENPDGSFQQYHADPRGSTVLITNAAGAVSDSFAYGPYGEGWGRTGTTNTPFQFNGRYGFLTDPNGLLSMGYGFVTRFCDVS